MKSRSFISIVLVCAILLSGCGSRIVADSTERETESTSLEETFSPETVDATEISLETEGETDSLAIEDAGDIDFETYVENYVYYDLLQTLPADGIFIEDVSATYLSQEYLEELEYNSQSNIYFGYSLADLDEQFEGDRYVFTLGDDGATTFERWEEATGSSLDDATRQTLRNLAIGSAVIAVTVTVAVVLPEVGIPAAIKVIAWVAAGREIQYAISGGLVSGIATTLISGFSTGDWDQAITDGLYTGSEGFKIGAIVGAIDGVTQGLLGLYSGSQISGFGIPEYAQMQLETGFSAEDLSYIETFAEYEQIRDMGLQPHRMDNGRLVWYSEDMIDWTTFEQRVRSWRSPLCVDGQVLDTHHLAQRNDGSLVLLPSDMHTSAGITRIWHRVTESGVDHGAEWERVKHAVFLEILSDHLSSLIAA